MAFYGEISPFKNVAQHLSERMPNCIGEVVPSVGHFFLLHAPDVFIERVVPFLHDPAGCVRNARESSAATTPT
jgi:pimeloyl-ACP methyl ester carboxylesterase